jgi:nitrate reductase gamma subunit
MQGAPLIFRIHVTVGMLLIAMFPFTRMAQSWVGVELVYSYSHSYSDSLSAASSLAAVSRSFAVSIARQ